MSSSPSSSQLTIAPGYFVDQKKGEVNELKQLLKNINIEKDVNRKREILKKVIAYMTLGIDVSRLFTEMIMAIETKDVVVKKMVYLYLCNYAHKEPDMALMSINSLLRDCENEDPMVRGLALRSLCNIRWDTIVEYAQKPLQRGMTDVSPYVRKTAVTSILKLNILSPGFAETHDYVSKLYQLLEDPDAAVIANSVMVLNELLLEKGGIETTQTTLIHLLNRIGEFSEWGLNAVLDLVSRYRPASEEEMFAIMNLLDPVLRTANSGAVLATFKCFLCLSAHLPDMHPQILVRAKPPLLTLIAGANPETQFAVLKHMEVLLPREFARGVFDDEFRQFFVRYSEPSYVKYLKTGLLPWIANEKNAKDIVAELVEYVTDVDSELAKKSIIAMGEIAIRVNIYTQDIVQNLLDLVDLDTPYVRAEAIKTAVKVVRTYPYVRHQLLPVLAKCLRRVEDPDAKAVLLWTLGEYGEELTEAPYLLESVVNNYADEASSVIKLSLLSASMKLFFKRAPEMQPILGKLLAKAVEDSTNQDIHDKGLMYYRLLAHNVDSAASVFRSHFQEHSDRVVLAYAEERDMVKKEKIWKEFNSLSVVYAQPSTQFIKNEYQFKYENAPLPDDTFTFSIPIGKAASSVANCTQVYDSSSSGDSLLDFGDATPAIPVAMQQHSVPVSGLSLDASSNVTPAQFQELWSALPDRYNDVFLHFSRLPASVSEIESLLGNDKIFTVASGFLPGNTGMKFFFYASGQYAGESGLQILSQAILNIDGSLQLIVKSNFGMSIVDEYLSLLAQLLSAYR